ncbi:MAG: DUF515 domain-containing protein [Methanobrevibacter sp.]|nr:DUF515 domain-containing protein [Candidatus Methanoflexus mossambicus]
MKIGKNNKSNNDIKKNKDLIQNNQEDIELNQKFKNNDKNSNNNKVNSFQKYFHKLKSFYNKCSKLFDSFIPYDFDKEKENNNDTNKHNDFNLLNTNSKTKTNNYNNFKVNNIKDNNFNNDKNINVNKNIENKKFNDIDNDKSNKNNIVDDKSLKFLKNIQNMSNNNNNLNMDVNNNSNNNINNDNDNNNSNKNSNKNSKINNTNNNANFNNNANNTNNNNNKNHEKRDNSVFISPLSKQEHKYDQNHNFIKSNLKEPKKNYDVNTLRDNIKKVQDNSHKNNSKLKNNDPFSKILYSLNKLFNKTDENNSYQKDNEDNKKIHVGAAIFGVIIVVLIFSAYYFLILSPFQEELNTAKTIKLNELNSLYKGPLLVDSETISLKSEIENANSPNEVNSIDIIRPATVSWRNYQNREINSVKDNFSRVMATYTANSSRNVIMNIDEAKKIINENDGTVLSNIEFKTPDTVVVPLLISRLQAGGGLISVGSITDVYFLESENTGSNSHNTGNEGSDNNINNSEDINNNGNNNGNNNIDNINNVNNGDNGQNLQNNSNSNSNTDILNDIGNVNENYPVISGATVLAILRSKDSGVIDVNYLKTKSNTHNEVINLQENQNSFSTDVEQLLQSIAAGGNDESLIDGVLNDYGLKLSQYERESNLAELDVDYIVLLEVPRSDVTFILNNMEDLIITIPSSNAPNWMINELKETYS